MLDQNLLNAVKTYSENMTAWDAAKDDTSVFVFGGDLKAHWAKIGIDDGRIKANLVASASDFGQKINQFGTLFVLTCTDDHLDWASHVFAISFYCI